MGNHRRMVVLTEGNLGVFSSKTATCLLRYCPDEVVAVLDSQFAGQKTSDILHVPKDVPIVSSVAETLESSPTHFVIGVAPQGGRISGAWRKHILDAIENGMHIASGLHQFLQNDEKFASAASKAGVELWDIRKPPANLPIAKAKAKDTKAFRVLTLGTDCNVGKMVASYEITQALKRNGVDAEFIATGQTGILIQNKGIAIDCVVSDFTAGAVETMILEEQDRDVLLIEGQGSLLHAGYSGVTLSLLHGSLPDAIILVHYIGRKTMRGNEILVAPIKTHIDLCERLCAPLHPTKVIGIAVNGFDLSDSELEHEIQSIQDETGLPAADVIRMGAIALVEMILKHRTQNV